jgi:tetratricopeptide (TPR) repeat protein
MKPNIIEISLKPGIQPQIDTALALRSSGRLEEALHALANPNEYNPYLCTVRGEIEFALGRFHDAALSYFAVVLSEPGNADAHYNLALCLQRSDRWDASCQAFERALSLDPGRDAARLGLGASLLYLNRLDEALASFYQCSDALEGPLRLERRSLCNSCIASVRPKTRMKSCSPPIRIPKRLCPT